MRIFLKVLSAVFSMVAIMAQPAIADDLRPSSILIYYAWPSIVFGDPGPGQAGVANRFGSYDHVVLGGGLEQTDHPEHIFTANLIADPAMVQTQVYGYVDVGVISGGSNLPLAEMELSLDRWQQLGVDGVLLDNFGHDYGTTRLRQNSAVNYAHTLGLVVIANAWDPDDVFSVAVTEENPDGLEGQLNSSDFYLYESYRRRLGEVENETSWQIKANKLEQYRLNPGIRVLAVTTKGTDALNQYVEDEFFHVWFTALLYGYDGVGYGEYQFSVAGASNGYAPVYVRPMLDPVVSFSGPIQKTGSTYSRLTSTGYIEVNVAQHTHVFQPVVTGVNGDAQGALELAGAWPNPANPGTHIHFRTIHEGKVTVLVYDVAGKLVRHLWGTAVQTGLQSIFWNGCDDQGKVLPSGVYYYLVDHQQGRAMGKVALIK